MVETAQNVSDSSRVPTIGDLIRTELDNGKSVRELEAASGHRVKYQTFQELSKQPPKQFPKETKTITGMSLALHCPETTVVLAYARGLGIGVDSGSDFALRLPAGVDDLAPEMKNALVSVVRAAVKQIGAAHVPGDSTSPTGTPDEATQDQEDGSSDELDDTAAVQGRLNGARADLGKQIHRDQHRANKRA